MVMEGNSPSGKDSSVAPSLFDAASSEPEQADARGAIRILAALEGRQVHAEQAHPSTGKKGAWLLLALLIVLLPVGWGLWQSSQHASGKVLAVAGNSPLPSSARLARASDDGTTARRQSPHSGLDSTSQPGDTAQRASAGEPTLSPEASAAIIEDWVSAGKAANSDDGVAQRNPLNILTPAATVAAVTSKHSGTAKGTQRSAEGKAGASGAGRTGETAEPAGRPLRAKARARKQQSNNDTAVLASVISLGLPESHLAGVKVYQEGGVTVRVIPLNQVLAKLQECRALGFFEREMCRWDVCSGHWGNVPECPTSGGSVN
jgi:hypothetical protein